MRRLSNVAHLYVVRLKARAVLVQEVFAILGIAVGVALLFASQVASASLNGSVAQMTSSVIGKATLQLEARDSHGFSEGLLREVQHTPGVRTAVPVLEQRIGLIGPTGSENVDLIGVEPGMVRLASPVDPMAIAPLSYAQHLTGMQGRVSRILVEPKPGAEKRVSTALLNLAGGRITPEPSPRPSTSATGPTIRRRSCWRASTCCTTIRVSTSTRTHFDPSDSWTLRQTLVRGYRGGEVASAVQVCI